MQKQGALARRPDTLDLLQASLAQIALAARPMRADGKAMSLVAQPLDKIQDRIARRQLERFAARNNERFAAGVTIGSLGNGDDRNLHSEATEHVERRRQLALAAVDQKEVRPRRRVSVSSLRDIALFRRNRGGAFRPLPCSCPVIRGLTFTRRKGT